jgi:hypothetical protein
MPRILGVDIETAPAMAWVWGLHDQNIGLEQLIQPSRVLCWSAKWFGEKKVFYDDERPRLTSGKRKESPAEAQKRMLLGVRELLAEADAVVGYNSDHFDLQKLNGEFVYHRIDPCPPLTSIDLFKTVKTLGYTSGKLAFVGPFLKVGQKIKHEGFGLWSACMSGDKEAWKRMEKYNRQDTELLEGLYEILKPYIKNHPTLGPGCPVCQSTKSQARGVRRTRTTVTQRLQCQSCGSWYSGSRLKAA